MVEPIKDMSTPSFTPKLKEKEKNLYDLYYIKSILEPLQFKMLLKLNS